MPRTRGAAELVAAGVRGAVDDYSSLPPVLTPHRLSLDVFHGDVSEKTLSKWRLEGGGPRYRRRGHPTRGRIHYMREDVVHWLKSLPSASTTTEERVRVEMCAGV